MFSSVYRLEVASLFTLSSYASRSHSSVEAAARWQFYDFSDKCRKLLELEKYCKDFL